MAKQRTVYVCTDCGNETSNWAGRCPKCGSWNTLKEITLDAYQKGSRARSGSSREDRKPPKKITELNVTEEIRFSTGDPEYIYRRNCL